MSNSVCKVRRFLIHCDFRLLKRIKLGKIIALENLARFDKLPKIGRVAIEGIAKCWILRVAWNSGEELSTIIDIKAKLFLGRVYKKVSLKKRKWKCKYPWIGATNLQIKKWKWSNLLFTYMIFFRN